MDQYIHEVRAEYMKHLLTELPWFVDEDGNTAQSLLEPLIVSTEKNLGII